jgi:hypothetical protein
VKEIFSRTISKLNVNANGETVGQFKSLDNSKKLSRDQKMIYEMSNNAIAEKKGDERKLKLYDVAQTIVRVLR